MATRLVSAHHELLGIQQGVVARWQLSGHAGDLAALDGLLRRGRWRTLYRGVYAAGSGTPSRSAQLWAAVLRCGPHSALSHFTAAELDGVLDDPSSVVHVAVPRPVHIRVSPAEFCNGLPRIILHRSSRLPAARHPAKAPPRTRLEETVLDLTDVARTFDKAYGWISTACNRRLVTADQLRTAAGCRPKLRWRRDILGALEEIAEGVLSNLEREYVHRVERPHQLPRPDRQVRTRRNGRSAYLDNLYGEFGLAVELDGLATHRAETRWQDIHRDNELAAAGIITLRYNWADVTQRPCEVAREIAAALRLRGWTGNGGDCHTSCRAGGR